LIAVLPEPFTALATLRANVMTAGSAAVTNAAALRSSPAQVISLRPCRRTFSFSFACFASLPAS
jgi:hypothetical protein